MNSHLQRIHDLIKQSAFISAEDKSLLEKAINDTEKELEIQNRELEIEAALERVRVVAIGMTKDDDLSMVCEALYKELKQLGFKNIRNAQGGFIDAGNKTFKEYSYSDYGSSTTGVITKYTDDPLSFELVTEIQQSKDAFFRKQISGDEFENWRRWRLESGRPDDPLLEQASSTWFYIYSVGTGGIGISTLDAISEQQQLLLKRFKNVFELTYTRFLDLQTAEAQLREADIQLALERVRARTMAMQKSDELPETSHILFEQMKELGEPAEQLTIGIVREEDKVIEISATLHGNTLKNIYRHSIEEPYLMNKVYKAWKMHQKTLIVELRGEELNAYNQYRNELTNTKMFPTTLSEEIRRIVYAAFFSKGMLALGTNEPRPLQSIQLLERFASVFDLTYSRFLELEKAETQAREADIQLALERVRAKTMAMQKSEELPEAANVLFQQIHSLGMPVFAAGYCIWDDDKQAITLWMSTEDVLQPPFKAPTTEDELFIEMRKGYEMGKLLHVVEMGGEELVAHYQYMRTLPVIGNFFDSILEAGHSFPIFQVMHQAYFSKGFLLFITYESVPEAHNIFKRFANVFEQTYTRFLDLKTAEAQVREAQIEASLERVRAKALAMHKSEDLNMAVATVFEELDKLDLGMIRCGISILDKEKRSADFFTTSISDQGKIVNVSGDESIDIHPLLQGAFDAWLKQSDFSYVLKGKDLARYYEVVAETNIILPESQIILSQAEEIRQYFYIATFQAGCLFAFRDDSFSDEAKKVMKRYADVFGLTYTRFLDLKQAESLAQQAELDLIKLKEEKKRTDNALAELKATQSQLIQSEKMASLGELTAGIAHEIQNPLNFVNNFSEVSFELIDEMNEEINKGNYDEVKSIAENVKQNLEKITHHGKRADGIVKGMLQHSRTGSGIKEPTDINALADEYIRLAYHGLRAKDKSFNVIMKTDYDERIGLINLIPQDFGRVILNLITNAFYAVTEKKNLLANTPLKGGIVFEPTVSISTKKIGPLSDGRGSGGETVQISIKDNGNGIPQNILDKIFQPFYTTKPTGKGTGLGLSLSYDIIKAHGGQLKVETTEGENAEFIIHLPCN